MAIKAQFKMSDIRKRFDTFLKEVEKMQVETLQELGEKCVTHARRLSPDEGFKDQTGNLRSSIGYAIYKDGVCVNSFYPVVSGVNDKKKNYSGDEGAKVGREFADQIGAGTKGLILIVTAGMNYAVYVEAKGRDVLASSEILAKRELPRMLDELVKNIKDARK